MIVTGILIFGVISLRLLPQELFPQIVYPQLTVVSPYANAAPEEIETLITKPLEDEISTLSGLKRVTSKSMEGVSQITVEFNFGSDVNLMSEKMRDKINTVKATLPADVKDPTLSLMDPANMPILKLVVSADLPESKLYDVAEYTIKPALEQVNNVGSVKLTGGRKREIQVVLDRAALKKRELSVSGVASSLSASGENVPGGKVNRGGQEITYRSMGEFGSVHEIANTVLGLYGNEVATRVSDIGKVYDTVQDETTRVFVDGKGVGDIGAVVLRDREILAESGMVVVALTIDRQTGAIVAGPEIVSRGFVHVKEADDLMEEVKEAIRGALAAREEPEVLGKELFGAIVRSAVRRFINQRFQRKPFVLPVILEV